MVDIFLWSQHAGIDGGLQACKSLQLQFGSSPAASDPQSANFWVSKYAIPLVVFSQHAMQLSYPSTALKEQRYPLIAFHAVPCLIMSFCFACTALVSSSFPASLGMDTTLFWGGDFSDWPFALIQARAPPRALA